jgi:hypothetical protein
VQRVEQARPGERSQVPRFERANPRLDLAHQRVVPPASGIVAPGEPQQPERRQQEARRRPEGEPAGEADDDAVLLAEQPVEANRDAERPR